MTFYQTKNLIMEDSSNSLNQIWEAHYLVSDDCRFNSEQPIKMGSLMQLVNCMKGSMEH